jgi:hypothetical protein
MARPPETSAGKKDVRSSPWWALPALSVSLAALVTGSFGLAGQWLVSKAQGKERQCTLAQQIVGDETLNPALSEANRSRTTSAADARLLRCLGE